MQQLQLFKQENKIQINKGNILFQTEKINKTDYVANLELPSGKFIIKYCLIEKKIESFEILDYAGYIYLSINMIKNIKNLLQAILKK